MTFAYVWIVIQSRMFCTIHLGVLHLVEMVLLVIYFTCLQNFTCNYCYAILPKFMEQFQLYFLNKIEQLYLYLSFCTFSYPARLQCLITNQYDYICRNFIQWKFLSNYIGIRLGNSEKYMFKNVANSTLSVSVAGSP